MRPAGVIVYLMPSCFMISRICSGVDFAFSLATYRRAASAGWALMKSVASLSDSTKARTSRGLAFAHFSLAQTRLNVCGPPAA